MLLGTHTCAGLGWDRRIELEGHSIPIACKADIPVDRSILNANVLKVLNSGGLH